MELSRKYYSLMAISAILLLGTLANAPDAFAAKPISVVIQYNGPGATVNVQKDANVSPDTNEQNNLDPCDTSATPCDTTVTVADGETFKILPITGRPTLESDSCFFVDGTKILFNNKVGDAKSCLHTSCSQP